MARDLKLGLNTGYWAGRGPPPGTEAIAEAERLGFDSIWTAEAYGSDCSRRSPGGAPDRAHAARHRDRADVGAPAGGHRDGGDDDGPPLGRALHPRPRRVGPAGRRGLVRHAVRQAARPHARVHRDRARRLGAQGPVTNDGPHYPLPLPGRHGPGQAAQVDRSTRCARTSRSTSAPRARRTSRWRRAVRRLARDAVLARATRASTARRSPRASRREGARRSFDDFEVVRDGAAHRHRRRGGRRPTRCARSTPSTSAAWARRARTSTPTSRSAWATRPRSTRCQDLYLEGKKDEAARGDPDAS